MTKRIIIMLILMMVLFGGIFGFKVFQGLMMKKYMANQAMPPISVSTTQATYEEWDPKLRVVGTIVANQGVDVTTEGEGLVKNIYFTSGTAVKEGEILVQLTADSEIALLNSLRATTELAALTYKRSKAQYEIQAISKANLEEMAADLKSKKAQVAEQEAKVVKKTIRAPFGGQIGISSINVGQYLKAGDKIVTLQALDPILVDFYLPQQFLPLLKVGQKIALTTDVYPDQSFFGTVSAINPLIDTETRNVYIQASLPNPQSLLLPGMFGTIEVYAGLPAVHLILPKAAISFNPYGESVYIVSKGGKDKTGKEILTVKQSFVKIGEARGDQVAILDGIKEGDRVVTSGQLKLKNDSVVVINNSVVPLSNPHPQIKDQ